MKRNDVTLSTEDIDRIEADRNVRPCSGTSRAALCRARRRNGVRPVMIEVNPSMLVGAGFLGSEAITDKQEIAKAAQRALASVLAGAEDATDNLSLAILP